LTKKPGLYPDKKPGLHPDKENQDCTWQEHNKSIKINSQDTIPAYNKNTL
jgi:hypothetical protein